MSSILFTSFRIFLHIKEQVVGITHIDQEKGMTGNRRTRAAPVFRLNHPAESFYRKLASSHFDERTDHRPHHVAQEPVGLDSKYPFVRTRLLPTGVHDAAIIGLHIGMQLTETRKVGIFEKHRGGFIHPLEIKWLEHPPRIMPKEGVLACGDVVLVLPIGGIEAGMGFVRHSPDAVNRNVGRKQTVEFIN